MRYASKMMCKIHILCAGVECSWSSRSHRRCHSQATSSVLSNWKVLLEAGQQDLSTQLDVVLMQLKCCWHFLKNKLKPV